MVKLYEAMSRKLKTAGIIFLACLALGAAWALWMGLKLFAWIAMAGLVVGAGVGIAWRGLTKRRLEGPVDRSRLS